MSISELTDMVVWNYYDPNTHGNNKHSRNSNCRPPMIYQLHSDSEDGETQIVETAILHDTQSVTGSTATSEAAIVSPQEAEPQDAAKDAIASSEETFLTSMTAGKVGVASVLAIGGLFLWLRR